MKTFLIDNLNNLPKLRENSALIGNFDGVHLAHQHLLEKAKACGLQTLIVTFINLFKDDEILTTPQEREAYFCSLGVDYYVVFDFKMVKFLFHNEFEKILKKLKVKNIICGNNFHYGFKNEGDCFDLAKYFNVIVEKDFLIDGIKVSTTAIKNLLHSGNIELANCYLGSPYRITGLVTYGNQIGRTLGFRTANVDYKNYTLLADGVYEVMVTYDNVSYKAMANIGLNPTLNLQTKRRLEVHILDFDEDLYEKEIAVSFLKYLRAEIKFNSKEELIESLKNTVKQIRRDLK